MAARLLFRLNSFLTIILLCSPIFSRCQDDTDKVQSNPMFPTQQTMQEMVCGKNEHFNTCGTACPPSCEQPKPGPCTLQCIIGCQCAVGYLRNNEGHCVLPANC